MEASAAKTNKRNETKFHINLWKTVFYKKVVKDADEGEIGAGQGYKWPFYSGLNLKKTHSKCIYHWNELDMSIPKNFVLRRVPVSIYR